MREDHKRGDTRIMIQIMQIKNKENIVLKMEKGFYMVN